MHFSTFYTTTTWAEIMHTVNNQDFSYSKQTLIRYSPIYC